MSLQERQTIEYPQKKEVWGPAYWVYLHTSATQYPKVPNRGDVTEQYNGPTERVEFKLETVGSLESDNVIKDDEFFPLGSQTAEYDDNKVRKIYLDSQEKRFETPKKRSIQIR